MSMNYTGRQEAVCAAMVRQGIDLLVLPPSANLEYLTGLPRHWPNFGNVAYPGDWAHVLLMNWVGRVMLLAPRMVADYDMEPGVAERLEVRVLADAADPMTLVRQALTDLGAPAASVAIENRARADTLLAFQQALPHAIFVGATPLFQPLRMVKDTEEIDVMRRAARIADAVMDAVMPLLHLGMTERDVADEVDHQMHLLGAMGPSFTTNVFQINDREERQISEKVGQRQLEAGGALSFDFGCAWQGYCSDFGRTVYLGEPTPLFLRAHDLVIAAQAAGIAALRAGEKMAAEADAAARAVIADGGMGAHFRHRLGHGIGLDVHEAPFLTETDTTMLSDGTTVTIEPSIYWIGHVGVRIEDVVVARPGGGEPLNTASRTLRVIA